MQNGPVLQNCFQRFSTVLPTKTCRSPLRVSVLALLHLTISSWPLNSVASVFHSRSVSVIHFQGNTLKLLWHGKVHLLTGQLRHRKNWCLLPGTSFCCIKILKKLWVKASVIEPGASADFYLLIISLMACRVSSEPIWTLPGTARRKNQGKPVFFPFDTLRDEDKSSNLQ